MKAKQALKILRVSRSTLRNYMKSGLIKATKLPTGQYDYDEESIYSFLNRDIKRKTVIYARVSTGKQKKDLSNQIEFLKNYCFQNGLQINGIYQDIASGISFEKRKDFFILLDELIENKIEKVVISYKDRLSRVGFDFFYYLFKKFGTEIVVVSEIGSIKLDSEEIFEEIVSLLHCYSIKLYSNRKKKIIKDLINEAS
ncbi:IS607 family transposase [Desulfobacter latus]|uniref:IS607 family transposase n=1 Tax=Desulfobacter latus TaxID=2292 RepID=A0A850T9G9_9BACT|nr:IS607 family transposase [Desulfobacter latus]NWH04847.1 IS607 family transposase [Desulfobacter latus]